MKLSEALSEDRICMALQGREKIEAIRELIGVLAEAEKIRDADTLTQAVMTRERLQSTGIGRGVAIPHGESESVGDVTCVLGLSREGIEYLAPDGCPVHILLLLVAPPERSTRYLSVLAEIARLFREDTLRTALLKARSPSEAMEQIRTQERI